MSRKPVSPRNPFSVRYSTDLVLCDSWGCGMWDWAPIFRPKLEV